MSECNPPCGAGETCKAGKCLVEESADSSSHAPKTVSLLLSAGTGLHVVTEAVPYVFAGFSAMVGGRHAFVGGVQGGIGFFEHLTTAEVGLNIGYRGIFTRSELGAGLMVLAQPQIWTGYADLQYSLGGSIGPILTYKQLVIAVPFGVSYLDTFQKNSHETVVYSPSLLVGLSF